jgi:hypothetical protein
MRFPCILGRLACVLSFILPLLAQSPNANIGIEHMSLPPYWRL